MYLNKSIESELLSTSGFKLCAVGQNPDASSV